MSTACPFNDLALFNLSMS